VSTSRCSIGNDGSVDEQRKDQSIRMATSETIWAWHSLFAGVQLREVTEVIHNVDYRPAEVSIANQLGEGWERWGTLYRAN